MTKKYAVYVAVALLLPFILLVWVRAIEWFARQIGYADSGTAGVLVLGLFSLGAVVGLTIRITKGHMEAK